LTSGHGGSNIRRSHTGLLFELSNLLLDID